jgi:hypothetical protein
MDLIAKAVCEAHPCIAQEEEVRVLGIEKANFAEDFSFVEVQLRTDQRQDLTLELATDVLQESLLKLWKVLHSDRIEALTEGNSLPIYGVKVADAKVQSSIGTGVVGLGFSTEDGLTQYFALPADLCAKLRTNMLKAEEIARSESGQPRQ